MFPQAEIFKAARLFNAHKSCRLHPISSYIDIVSSIVFLNDTNLIGNLKNELPRYLTKAYGIGAEVDPVQWLKTNKAELPHWSSATKMVLLLQPSSAASERVFSIHTMLFGRQGLIRTLKAVDMNFE